MSSANFLCMQFFTTEPFGCEPSSLPKYPPSKEIDAKRRDEEARRFVTLPLISIFRVMHSAMNLSLWEYSNISCLSTNAHYEHATAAVKCVLWGNSLILVSSAHTHTQKEKRVTNGRDQLCFMNASHFIFCFVVVENHKFFIYICLTNLKILHFTFSIFLNCSYKTLLYK